MPKVGMEPLRRAALVQATIEEIGSAGTLDVTVSQIARRAGMSSGLAHHYFGGKEQIFLAAMRHTLAVYGQEVRAELADAQSHYERLVAVIRACFTPASFHHGAVAAWLNFYVLALTSREADRLLRIYRSRLRSNLVFNLRPLVGARANDVAARIAGLIDGLYLHAVQDPGNQSGEVATAQVVAMLESELRDA